MRCNNKINTSNAIIVVAIANNKKQKYLTPFEMAPISKVTLIREQLEPIQMQIMDAAVWKRAL